MHKNKIKAALGGVLTASLLLAGPAMAAGNVVVNTPTSQGWGLGDTNAGGTVQVNNDLGAPTGFGEGSLKLSTDATTTAKAQDAHGENRPLAAITQLSYWTYQKVGNQPFADAAYQLPVFLNGNGGFTTLVYEPYQNTQQGAIVPGQWQKWDVAAGKFWSTRTVTPTAGGTGVVGTPGGPATYTLADIKAMFPNAQLLGIIMNIGSNNPNYVVGVDGVQLNDTVYNFEPVKAHPTTKADCKNDGYKTFADPSFKNQGQCVAYVERNSNNNNEKNTVSVINRNTQRASSGNATVSGNTTGGNASSGNASNSNTTTSTVTTNK